jgi:hypothetical protein
LGDTYARDLQGGAPTEAHFDFLFDADEIGEDFVVYGPLDQSTGPRPVIGGIQRGVFSQVDRDRIIPNIKKIRNPTESRPNCSPEPIRQDILDKLTEKQRKFQLSEDKREYRLWLEAKNGKAAHWDRWRSNPIPSATAGWTIDKIRKTPTLSENFRKHPERQAVFDYMNQKAERAYLKIAPAEFRSRRKFVQSRISLEHRLGKTIFTTLAINQYGDEMPAMNFHIDTSDKDSGLTCISVFNKGHYTGGYFVLPQYRCAFKVGDGDVFVGDSRKVHGVTQIEGEGQRLSVVSYLRTDLGYAEYVEKAYPPRSPRPQFRVDRYQIAIPSYRRQETLKEKTLAFLNRHNIDPKRVTIFVADEAEYKIYTKALKESHYNKIVIAAPGLMAARNFMALYYKEGTPVVFIDDDIQDLETIPFVKKAKKDEDAGEAIASDENQKEQNKLEPVRNLEADVIFRGFNAMREYQSYIWGICAARNGYFMKNRVAVGLYYIIGSFYGTIIRHSKDLLVGTADKEDYERSALYFIKDGRVARLDSVTARSKYYGEKGGLQETRTPKTVEEGARYMLKKYPKYCYDLGKRQKGAMKGMHEIRLKESD